jgi:undecaprenyl-diphosphatase
MLDSLIGSLNNLDVLLFYMINVGLHNSFLDVIMKIITNAGTQIFWIGICVVLFIFGGERGKNVALLCIIGLLLGYFISEFLKYAIARPRPFIVLNGVNLVTSMDGYSFPSGHAVTSFTGCIIIGKGYGFFYPLLILASVVAFSRIYLGVHYPSDVIFGVLIGIFCALIVLRFEDDIIKLKDRAVNKVNGKT